MPKVAIASLLTKGFVGFLTPEGEWSLDIDAAEVAHSEDEEAALLARAENDAKQNKVVEPYLIEVTLENGRTDPVEIREYIRARGPSVPNPGAHRTDAQ